MVADACTSKVGAHRRRTPRALAPLRADSYTEAMPSRFLVLLVALPLVACNNSIVVALQTGDQQFGVSASALNLPTELRDDTSGTATIRTIDCSQTNICPSTTEVPVACTAGVCDPSAISFAVPVGDVVDFDALLQSAGTLLRLVDAIEIESVSYSVSPNTLTIDLPATTVLWGPESATETSASLQPIGTVPSIPAHTQAMGEMDIDANGSLALGDYIVGTSRRVRFFARTAVDLAPGSPFPDGMATFTVNIRVRAYGRIVN